jgi:hypothetical protein
MTDPDDSKTTDADALLAKVQPIDGGLVRWRGLLWARSAAGARRAIACWYSGSMIARGEPTYYPMTNGDHRTRRVAAKMWDKLAAERSSDPDK